MEYSWPAIMLVGGMGGLIALPMLIVFLIRRNMGLHGERARVQKTKEIVERHSRGQLFICNFFEVVDTGEYQLRGQSLNTSLRPGMQVEIGNGRYAISEVYADDETSDTPNHEVSPSVADTPIVIRGIAQSDVEHIRERLKSDAAIVLKLREAI